MLQLFFAVAFSAVPLTLYVPPIRSLNLFVETIEDVLRQTSLYTVRAYPRIRLVFSRFFRNLFSLSSFVVDVVEFDTGNQDFLWMGNKLNTCLVGKQGGILPVYCEACSWILWPRILGFDQSACNLKRDYEVKEDEDSMMKTGRGIKGHSSSGWHDFLLDRKFSYGTFQPDSDNDGHT
ncbi:hypothetical protein D5086_029057 [Populus alba]|uniref:Uncharacterized protein n=1 Tax=Populus alba TaxID=43335 RepID=A0ACC4ATE3_POPAL